MEKSKLRIVLIEPDIPQNTGNIMRLAVATNIPLLLVGKLGFSLSEKKLKRAGMDYIDNLKLTTVTTVQEYLECAEYKKCFLTTKSDKLYTDIKIDNPDEKIDLIFGSESSGLPKFIYEEYKENLYTIPMVEGTRSLNLSSSVAIVTYHILSTLNFKF